MEVRRVTGHAVAYTWPEFVTKFGPNAERLWRESPVDLEAQQTYKAILVTVAHNRELLLNALSSPDRTQRLAERTRKKVPKNFWVGQLPDDLDGRHGDGCARACAPGLQPRSSSSSTSVR